MSYPRNVPLPETPPIESLRPPPVPIDVVPSILSIFNNVPIHPVPNEAPVPSVNQQVMGPELHDGAPTNVIDIDVNPMYLSRFTASVEKYAQDSHKSFIEYKRNIGAVLEKLSFHSPVTADLDALLLNQQSLTPRASKLLCIVLTESLTASAATVTQIARKSGQFVTAFSVLQQAWPQNERATVGPRTRKELLSM